MGCSRCGGNNREVVHEVQFPNGTTASYLTEIEAREQAIERNGTYAPVVRPKRS